MVLDKISDRITAKIIIIGEGGCGKTSLLQRFTENTFNDCVPITIGIDFRAKTISGSTRKQEDSGMTKKTHVPVTLQIWDTAGQERFGAIVSNFYRQVDGVMLVFSLDDPETFAKCFNRWLPQVKSHAPYNRELPLVIVGNKMELPYPAEFLQEVRERCQSNGLTFLQASAKTGEGVDEVFRSLAEKITPEMKIEVNKTTLEPKNSTLLGNLNCKCV